MAAYPGEARPGVLAGRLAVGCIASGVALIALGLVGASQLTEEDEHTTAFDAVRASVSTGLLLLVLAFVLALVWAWRYPQE